MLDNTECQLKSGLVNAIEEEYSEYPYHNFPHGKQVGEASIPLSIPGMAIYNYAAGLIHDIIHPGVKTTDTDELSSAQRGAELIIEHGYGDNFAEKIQSRTIGTIFSQRAKLILPEQRKLADADLSALGMEYNDSIESHIRMLLEVHEGEITNEVIKKWFLENRPKFFNFLTGITGEENEIFLTDVARHHYPDFAKNRDTMFEEMQDDPSRIIGEVRKLEEDPLIAKYRQGLNNLT